MLIRHFAHLSAALLLFSCFSCSLAANDLPLTPDIDTATKYIEAYTKNTHYRIIEQVNKRSDPSDSLPLPKDTKFDGSSLFNTPKEELRELRQYTAERETQADERLSALREDWIEIKSQKIPRDLLLRDLAAANSPVGLIATLFKSENRWIWIGVFLGLVCMGLATVHDRRHDIRRRLFGTRARNMRLGLLVKGLFIGVGVLSLTVIFFGEFIYEALLPTISDVEQSYSVSEIEQETETWQAENLTFANLQLKLPESKSTLISKEQGEARLALREIEVKEKLLANLIEKLNSEQEGLKSVQEQLQQRQEDIKSSAFWMALLRFGFALGSFVVIAIFSRKLSKQIVTRFEVNSNTCPSCLAQNTFSDDIGGAGAGIVRCDNLVPDPDYPDEDQECGFELRSIYKAMPKLCIPTLGHVYAGKTHWLAMAYRELSNSQFDRDLSFMRVQGAQTEVFDDLVSDLIDNRQGTGATQVNYVDPLLFHFTDKDRFGKTDSLINMFDYSGEVTTTRTIEDPLRARALDADGYLFFLDPTLPAEPQQKALNDFAEDVKILKGLEGGRTIQVPVAICVSKIDLLCNQHFADPNNPISGGVIGQFYREVGELDPNGTDFSLKTIDAFSEMMQRYTSIIWPGWNINQAVDRLFDGRFRYFPLSPVGIQSLGADDLDGVVQVPYRVIHPLLWLLHMNGYKVLN